MIIGVCQIPNRISAGANVRFPPEVAGKMLGFETPAERFKACVAMID
jgi:hypothetical protein